MCCVIQTVTWPIPSKHPTSPTIKGGKIHGDLVARFVYIIKYQKSLKNSSSLSDLAYPQNHFSCKKQIEKSLFKDNIKCQMKDKLFQFISHDALDQQQKIPIPPGLEGKYIYFFKTH